ncbi:hypothetical protein CDL60_07160 [Roseateles noduli]|nr:hypothetical protein CDL60_07160 [Roseateles noduli]
MNFVDKCGGTAGWTVGYQRDGRELLVVMMKRTYRMPRHGEAPTIAPAQQPLVQHDVFSGEAGVTAPLLDSDYAHRKPACDVLLVGSAHAPGGAPVKRMPVGLRVGAMTKQFEVVGPREWRQSLLGLGQSEPQPFLALPLSYDVAFGGTDVTEADLGRTFTYLENPVGRGYRRHLERLDGQALPNTEEAGKPVEHPRKNYRPMAFSPIGRNWSPRMGYAGTYDRAWQESRAPFWPDDFDDRYFQAAPTDQLIAHPAGGEEVTLLNLTPDGRRSFRLPRERMPVTFIPHRGRDVTQEAVLDTIVLEPDEERFSLVWRTSIALGKSVFDVRETIAGEMSAAWHRARRFPEKRYYAGLGEAVAAHRGRSR